MFTNVLGQITTRLDSRFILNLFFPSFLFWGGLVAVYASTMGLEDAIVLWRAQTADAQLLQFIVFLTWTTFFAYLLANQLIWLTKQFEGYWTWIPVIGNRLAEARRKHYQGVLKSKDESGDYESIYYAFPLPGEPDVVMPTQLGNILKNSEQYAYQRYDMDAVLLWPRLYSVLPGEFRATLDGARASLDFTLVVATLSGLFGILASLILMASDEPWLKVLLVLAIGFGAAFVAYRSSLEVAVTYSQLLKSAFDLYRDDLRKKLGFQRLDSLDNERAFWRAIYELIYRGETSNPAILVYVADSEGE